MKDFTYLDRYINKENLSNFELEYMHLYPLKMFAYGIKGNTDYEYIYGLLAITQRMLHRQYKSDIFHIINATGLTKWKKFWLKFSYVFL